MDNMYCSSEFTKFCKATFVNPTVRIRLLDELEQDIFDDITKKVENFYTAKVSNPVGTSGFDVSFDKEVDANVQWDVQSLVYAILEKYACEEKHGESEKEEEKVEKPTTEVAEKPKAEETAKPKEEVPAGPKPVKPAEKGAPIQSAPLA